MDKATEQEMLRQLAAACVCDDCAEMGKLASTTLATLRGYHHQHASPLDAVSDLARFALRLQKKSASKIGKKGGKAYAARVAELARLEAEGDPAARIELEAIRDRARQNGAQRRRQGAKSAPRNRD
jgi:hypothetical protein